MKNWVGVVASLKKATAVKELKHDYNVTAFEITTSSLPPAEIKLARSVANSLFLKGKAQTICKRKFNDQKGVGQEFFKG